MNSSFFFPKSQTQGLLAEIDPRIKILTFFALVVTVIFTPSPQFLKFVLYFTLLLILIIGSQISLTLILIRLFFVGTMVFFIGVLVFVFQRKPLTQNLAVIWNIFIKTVLVVICLAVLTQTTEFFRIIKALEWFKVPKLFISLLGLTYRYIQLLFGESIKVKRSIDSRSFGKRSKIEEIVILKSTLLHIFIRTFERSERIYAAMLSRGYEGTVSTMSFLYFKKRDFVFAGLIIAFIFFVLVAL